MTKFSTINLMIFIIAIFLSENLAAEETILPKPQPKNKELSKKEIILPKSLPKNDELQKDEASQIKDALELYESRLKAVSFLKFQQTGCFEQFDHRF